MCRRKPGPRCGAHAGRHLASLQQRRDHLADQVKGLTVAGSAPGLVRRYSTRVSELDVQIADARIDVDATQAGMAALAGQLANPKLSASTRAALVHRQTVAANMRLARRAQMKAMPALASKDPDVVAAYDRLGKARERCAYFDARHGAATTMPTAAEIQHRVDAENEALVAEIAYRYAASGNAADTTHLTRAEADTILTGDAALANRLIHLSHMRACFDNPDAHPPRLYDEMVKHAEQITTERVISPETAPRQANKLLNEAVEGLGAVTPQRPAEPTLPATVGGKPITMATNRRYQGFLSSMMKMQGRRGRGGMGRGGSSTEKLANDLMGMIAGDPTEEETGMVVKVPGI